MPLWANSVVTLLVNSRGWSSLRVVFSKTRLSKFFHRSRFLRLPWKNRVALKFFTVFNIFFTIQDFWAALRLPWKTELPRNFLLHWIYFLHSGVMSNLRLPWKAEFALKIFTVLKYFLPFRIFEHLALALKTEFALRFFTVLNMLFIIQDFWATRACPENRVCPEIVQDLGGGRHPRRPTSYAYGNTHRFGRLVLLCVFGDISAQLQFANRHYFGLQSCAWDACLVCCEWP